MSRTLDFVEEVEALSYARPHVTTELSTVSIKFSSMRTASRFFVQLQPTASYPFAAPAVQAQIDFGKVRAGAREKDVLPQDASAIYILYVFFNHFCSP